ncbi:MAG TPA: NAD(P)/FAD-dependent oxidoreductase [Actinomycetota bacterium]|jgi:phytoene dehydrogenase-like protein
MSPANRYDAIVIGGGHNGLVAAAYLARTGARTIVLEARPEVGGASSTSAPWPDAPEFRVTTLSYVMSLMPDTIVSDLSLPQHGYRVHPVGPYYIAFPDGRSLTQYEDPAKDYAEFAKFSKKDAEALPEYSAWIERLAAVLGPLLMTTPPRIGSRQPADLVDQIRFAWRFRGLDVRTIADLTRLMTMSVDDLLDDWFESDQAKVPFAINGVIGTWAGPCEPGTAYVMAHHSIGDVGDGKLGEWGVPEGGMGAVAAAIRRSAESFGAQVRTGARVERVLTSNGRATGVALAGGEELSAPVVVTAIHPKITFLEQVERGQLPEDFVRDIEHWKTRSGTVKINLAVSRLPRFTADPDREIDYSGGFELAHSVDYLERAYQEARAGHAAVAPFSDGVIPTMHDPTLAPEGTHIVSLFTQWVPHTWASQPHDDELARYADRVIDGYDDLAPGFRDSILHRQVIGPHEMEHAYGLVGGNIFHGELSADQLFHMRPSPGYADYRTPIAGLYQCSSATHAGGGVCGIPAYNCVREIRRDRRRARRRRS